MKHKLHFLLCVLLLLFVSAGTSFAVTVKGHDGTELALSQIPDIIRHVTGQTSGDFQFGKDSLYIYGAAPQDANYYKETSTRSTLTAATNSKPHYRIIVPTLSILPSIMGNCPSSTSQK
ncbi:MAG: hypothetical protein IJG36_07225 [Synergistaceae bacterium]|nr:hypothetical protein [Synergistaceae bacterium]